MARTNALVEYQPHISLIYHIDSLIWLYEPDTDLIQTSYSVSGTVSPSYSVSYDHTLSVTCLSDPPCSTSAAGASRWCLTLAARTLARCTHARRQRPRALVLGLARAAQDRQATRATVDVDVPRRGEGGGAGRVARACSTAPDGSSTSIASASIADSRSSGTLLGEAFSATRAHTAHRHRNGGRPVLSAVRRKGAGAWRLAYLILCPCVACAHSASGGYTPLRTQWPQQQKARQGTGRGGAASVGDRTRPKPTTFGRKWTRPAAGPTSN